MKSSLATDAARRAITVVVLLSFLGIQIPVQSSWASEDRDENEKADLSAGGAIETSPGIVLSPGFLMQLSSSQDQNLNGTFRIRADGKIDLPYNVRIEAGGKTLNEFRIELLNVYKRYFKRKPSLKAAIRQRRYYVEVRGLVAQPGTYLIKKEALLDEVIALAGGLAKSNKANDETINGYVRIDQRDGTYWVDLGEYYKLGLQKDIPAWQGGDRLFVQKEKPEGVVNVLGQDSVKKVNVLGEVRNPGEITYRQGGDGYYYLTKTGGPTSTSDLERVALVRRDSKTGEATPIQFGRVDEIKGVQEADLIIFYPARPTNLERTLQTTSVIVGIITASLLAYIAVKGVNK